MRHRRAFQATNNSNITLLVLSSLGLLLTLLSSSPSTILAHADSSSSTNARPEYIGPRDRFWKHHATHKTLIIDGIEHYSTIQNCLQTTLTVDDQNALSTIPTNRTIGRLIVDTPTKKFGQILLVEIVNAMTPTHVRAVQALASCIRTHIPSLYERRALYLE